MAISYAAVGLVVAGFDLPSGPAGLVMIVAVQAEIMRRRAIRLLAPGPRTLPVHARLMTD